MIKYNTCTSFSIDCLFSESDSSLLTLLILFWLWLLLVFGNDGLGYRLSMDRYIREHSLLYVCIGVSVPWVYLSSVNDGAE